MSASEPTQIVKGDPSKKGYCHAGDHRSSGMRVVLSVVFPQAKLSQKDDAETR
jgi:hypothetical protein